MYFTMRVHLWQRFPFFVCAGGALGECNVNMLLGAAKTIGRSEARVVLFCKKTGKRAHGSCLVVTLTETRSWCNQRLDIYGVSCCSIFLHSPWAFNA
jgi:hypothetical protein